MSKRQRIRAALLDAGFEIKSLEYCRARDYAYGDSWDSSYWIAETKCGEQFHSMLGIHDMLEEIAYARKINYELED